MHLLHYGFPSLNRDYNLPCSTCLTTSAKPTVVVVNSILNPSVKTHSGTTTTTSGTERLKSRTHFSPAHSPRSSGRHYWESSPSCTKIRVVCNPKSSITLSLRHIMTTARNWSRWVAIAHECMCLCVRVLQISEGCSLKDGAVSG